MSKHSKSSYDSFDEFWPDFTAAMKVAIDKKKPAVVGALLRRQSGFIPNKDQVQRVYEQLLLLPHSGSFQFAMFLTARTGRSPSRMLTGLGDELWTQYLKIADFPDTEHPTWIDVRDWILARVSRARSAKHELIAVGRSMFAMLMRVRDRDFYTNALVLLTHELAGGNRKKMEAERNEIEGVVSELLLKRTPNRKDLELLSRCGKAMHSEMQVVQEQRRQAVGHAEALHIEITNLKTELESKDEQLKECAALIESLRGDLKSATEKLSLAQEQIVATDQHWNVVLRQKLSGLLAKLRSDIQHETQEITLCLDRSSPNTTMALDRVRQIDKIIDQVNNTR